MQEMAGLIDADTWIWVLARANPDLPGDAGPLGIVDGGWISEKQGERMTGVNRHIPG
jgi:hypothetical protein